MTLIELAPKGKFVFVGDTHGDVNASEYIIQNYLTNRVRIVFLGDYVDRSPQSEKNVDYLLEQKKEHPRKVYLLQGNHERRLVYGDFSSDFWEGLTRQKALEYEEIFRQFPLALSVGGIIATHSGLPNVKTLKEINLIRDPSGGYDDRWHDIVWGDVADVNYNHIIERSCIYEFDFNERMSRLGKNILIRSHDSNAPEQMFDGRCLTLFTSGAYQRKRTIAIADFTKNHRITSVDDLIVEEIR